MKTISLEDDVFAEIEKLTSPLFTHSDVVRKLLKGSVTMSSPPPAVVTTLSGECALVAFVKRPEFLIQNSGIKKYLEILGWLYAHHASDFKIVEDYRRGNRVYFARSQKAVEDGGNGDIQAKLIPNSPIWTLATIDHKSKRSILADVLRLLRYKPDQINIVTATIPDSDRRSAPLDLYS